MHAYLTDLGVDNTLLTEHDREFLDENGYLNLGKILSDAQLVKTQKRISDLLQAEGQAAGSELFDSKNIRHPKELGADRLANLVNKGAVFDVFYTHPKVLAGVDHVLGSSFKLSSLNYRAAKPGDGLQNLHVDWHEAVKPGSYQVCNSIWLLDDFSKSNGATRIVPKTHLSGALPEEVLENPLLPHPNEIYIEAEAGSVFLFNAHVWHGGTQNQTTRYRRCIHSYFCRRDQPQQLDQAKHILNSTKDRIGPQGVYILGI